MERQARFSLSVVIPAFNEERRIAATLDLVGTHLRSRHCSWEIRVVDDGSTDGTAAVVSRSARLWPEVVLQREPHRGKGGAVKAGLLAATTDYRFLCDADLSMPIAEIDRFLPPSLAAYDIAIGTREGAGARRVGEPVFRHITGRIFNFFVQRLALPGIEDSQCGFKMFTARAVEAIFPAVCTDGWAFDIEVLYIARHLGLRVIEVPIEWHFRPESRVSVVRDSFTMFREVLEIRARGRRGAYGPANEVIRS